MANIKKAILERMRSKVIKYKMGSLEKELLEAYGRTDFNEVERLSNKIIELGNKQLDDMNNKINQKLSERERQLDEAFDMIGDINRGLGLNFTPREEAYVQNAMRSNSISEEEEMEAERLLQQIMSHNTKRR